MTINNITTQEINAALLDLQRQINELKRLINDLKAEVKK